MKKLASIIHGAIVMPWSVIRAVARFLASLDAYDALSVIGLACLWWGCWMAWNPAAPIVCGAVMLTVGIYGVIRKSRSGDV